MKYKAIIETDDYKDFEFFEDGNGKYMVGKDAATENNEWIALYFTECEQESCEDAISQKIDEFELKGKTAEIWFVKGKLQIRYLGIIHNIPLPPVTPQPEIVRCKDCKHRDAEIGFCKGRGWPMQLAPDDGFCDKGERRIK